MEGTLWKKGRLSYEKRHFCVEEDENGELCLVGRVKTREGKVDNKLLLASLERVDVVDEPTYEFLVEGGGVTLNLRVESRSEFTQWVNGLRAVLGMPDVEFTSSWMGEADGNTFAGGLSEAMPPAHPRPLSYASPPASGAPAPNPPPPAYSTAAPPRLQAGSNLLARPPASPGAQPHPSRYPVIGGGGGGGAAVRAVAGYSSAQPPPPAYAAASLGYQDGVAVAPPTAAPIAAPTAPGCRQGAPPRGAAGWLPSAVAEAAPPAAMSPVPRAAGAAGAAGGGAAWAGGRAEGRAEGENEGTQDLKEAAEAEAREEAELEEAWLSEVEPEVLEAARELGIRLEVRSERRHLWVAQLYALEPLAEGWSKQTDGRGRAYFYHAETGESRWRAPAYDAHRALLEGQHAASSALDALAGGAAARRALRLQRARGLAAMEKEKEGAEAAEDEQHALDESMRLAFHQLLTAGFFRVDERTLMFSA